MFHLKLCNIAAPLILMLRTSTLTDSSINAIQIAVKENGVDAGSDGSKLVEKLLKSCQKSKNLKGLKNLQKPLVWRNQVF